MSTHILLAVTGMSPAVITETLYAISQHKLTWPNKIIIITTKPGKQAALDILPSRIVSFCEEYNMPEIELTCNDVLVVPGENGEPVDDARTLDDHEMLGNFIIEKVRDLTFDKDTTIHASIAGGRKTMTFYMGYAMSLFGRPTDQLSHVLVEPVFEKAVNFFYPTRQTQLIYDRYDNKIINKKGQPIDAKDASITFIDIPFILMRKDLPKFYLVKTGELNFRDLVELSNSSDRSKSIELRLPIAEPTVEIHDTKNNKTYKVKMSPIVYIYYRTLARATKESYGYYRAPENNKDYQSNDWNNLAKIYNEIYRLIGEVPLNNQFPKNTSVKQRHILRTQFDWLMDYFFHSEKIYEGEFNVDEKSLKLLTEPPISRWYAQRRTEVRNAFQNAGLHNDFILWLQPRQIYSKQAGKEPKRIENNTLLESPKRTVGGLGIMLDRHQIKLID